MKTAIKGKDFARPFPQSNIGKRGQGIAMDFLFAVIVFMLVLGATTVLIDNNAISALEKRRANELNAKASQTMDMLVRTTGLPNNWEEKNIDQVTAIGLAKRDRVLEQAKVGKFRKWIQTYDSPEYKNVKSLLLIGYDYYFKMTDSAGHQLYIDDDPLKPIQSDEPPDSRWDNMIAVNVKRVVNFNGGEAIAELTLYHPRYRG